MSKNQKKLQLTGIIPNDVNSNIHPNNIQAPQNEEDSKKGEANPHIQIHQISTSGNSPEQNSPSENPNIIINSENKINMEVEQEVQEIPILSFGKEYFKETWKNLLLGEKKFYPKINCNYMSSQNDINQTMRAVLIDWIIEVHSKYCLKEKTLFHSIFIIDTYLSQNTIDRHHLQLLGLAALLIACKQSEIYFPNLQDFSDLSDHAYTKKEINEMEIKVMQHLNFDILASTVEEFYGLLAEFCEFTEKQRYFGEYFLNASLNDYSLLKYRPSLIAVACCYMVIKYFNLDGAYSLLDLTFLGVTQEELKSCVDDLINCMKNLSNSFLMATKNKYLSGKYLRVAEICLGNGWIAIITNN